LFDPENLKTGDVAIRFLANYVPRLEKSDIGQPRYQQISREDDEDQTQPGDLKTFEHLAADAREPSPTDPATLQGQPFLAVLKADVDRLGLIFSSGIQSISLGRFSAVSRFIDFFFSAHLPNLLRTKYPSTYTVYAGGDDLLLIGPWHQTIDLSYNLNHEFTRWTGSNPSITISAAIELMKVSHPLNRAAANAEERLEQAKHKGRNRLSLIDHEPFPWSQVTLELQKAQTLTDYLNHETIPLAFAYRLLSFDADRRAAEDPKNPNFQNAANWRSRWGYQLARNLSPQKSENLKIINFLNSLLGLDQDLKKQGTSPSARTAITVAVYRTRT
jgi:CRISPR-associated protein Csm1